MAHPREAAWLILGVVAAVAAVADDAVEPTSAFPCDCGYNGQTSGISRVAKTRMMRLRGSPTRAKSEKR